MVMLILHVISQYSRLINLGELSKEIKNIYSNSHVR